jgi:hypothetical protein
MAEPEIETHIRYDTVWQRPTWPLGRWGKPREYGFTVHDGFASFFGEDPEAETGGRRAGQHHAGQHDEGHARLAEHDRALAVLELKWPVTLQDIKQRYKSLVKKLHPDANGGDKAAEEHLKVVNQAYSTLKSSSLF